MNTGREPVVVLEVLLTHEEALALAHCLKRISYPAIKELARTDMNPMRMRDALRSVSLALATENFYT